MSAQNLESTPAALDAAPVLAHAIRGGVVESAHRASVAVTAPDGSVELELGSASDPIFPRSSNKPVQALAMVRHGLDVAPHHLALVCASHSGEPFHLDAVREILDGAGLTVRDLQNTPDYPIDDEARLEWIRAGHGKESLAQNCSGKHSGMLATCVANGWDHTAYLDRDHPLQRACDDTLAELTGERVAATAVDGCGAPVMAVSLAGLARAFGRIASAAPGTDEARVADAIRSHPEFLGGTRRDVTTLIQRTPGAIAKDGAEAVYAVGLADGRGIALKVADGGQRARTVILAAVMRRLGIESGAIGALEDAPILGHGEPVGSVVAVGI
ncbi:asparaginase [Knoellia flava TL1]|uniref:Asparaginase n=2 Tax=Knoellia flava TaxID=913969 RepID=A0A8H9KSJ6_9MICO|nr:asparaginase [Knoellia flava]KGN35764.1 asparaginase [Knoellia flava TL1]GGB80995.1 asparaginase [Knoellia flava]